MGACGEAARGDTGAEISRASSPHGRCLAGSRRGSAGGSQGGRAETECEPRGRQRGAAERARAARRDVAATTRRPRCSCLRSAVASALLCVCALPSLAGIQWDRAMPFEGRAEGGWKLTVSGSFSAAPAKYKCEFAPIETSGGSIASDPVTLGAEVSGAIVCDTPQWGDQFAAQRTRLRVVDDTTSSPVAGPGGTAEIITYVLTPALPCKYSVVLHVCVLERTVRSHMLTRMRCL